MKNIGFNINRPSIINLINVASFQEVLTSLNKNYEPYILDGKNIFNIDTFLKGVTNQILQNGIANNLSNFEDLFFQFLINNPKKRTVFIWTNVDNMLSGQLEALLIFSDILSSITRKLYQDRRVHINIFFGDGSNFPIPSQLQLL